MDSTRGVYSFDGLWLIIPTMPGIFKLQKRNQKTVGIGGQGKNSNLRYDLRRIAALASRCLKPLSHLSSNFLSYLVYASFGNIFEAT